MSGGRVAEKVRNQRGFASASNHDRSSFEQFVERRITPRGPRKGQL
jgi:hypothetical protein